MITTALPTYFGECPTRLRRTDARIIRVDTYGKAKSFDCEVTKPSGWRMTVFGHLTPRKGTAEWVVLAMGGTRVWRYLAADGWVDAIAEADPRASVFFAITRAELTFDSPWKAINAAAMASEAPTFPFRGAVEIRDEWGTPIPYAHQKG